MKRLILILGLSLGSASAHSTVVCFNNALIGTAPLVLKLQLPLATARFKDAECRLKRIKYNPVSPKYKGWIRVGTPKGDCPELGETMLGKSAVSKKPVRVYWISVSEEVQQDAKGFIQLGYENDADPGTGPEMKSNLICYPDRD